MYDFTVDIVKGRERSKQFDEVEAVLEASFFDKRSAENHHHRSDLVQ